MLATWSARSFARLSKNSPLSAASCLFAHRRSTTRYCLSCPSEADLRGHLCTARSGRIPLSGLLLAALAVFSHQPRERLGACDIIGKRVADFEGFAIFEIGQGLAYSSRPRREERFVGAVAPGTSGS